MPVEQVCKLRIDDPTDRSPWKPTAESPQHRQCLHDISQCARFNDTDSVSIVLSQLRSWDSIGHWRWRALGLVKPARNVSTFHQRLQGQYFFPVFLDSPDISSCPFHING